MQNFLKRHQRPLLLLLLVLQMTLIFTMSSFGSDSSNAQSNQIIHVLHQVFPNLSNEHSFFGASNLTLVVRKTAHFAEYVILGLLFFLVYRAYFVKLTNAKFSDTKLSNIKLSDVKFSDAKLLLFALCSSFLYACTDELHQLFVSGRSGQFTDVLIDTLGAFFGCLLLLMIRRLRKAWRARRRL